MMTDIDRIVKFFLHIFHLQSCLSGEIDEGQEYRLVSSDSDLSQIYELRVKHHSAWKTRRMSIRRIGESVESKSTCYVVTYDDRLVIKIPPFPLADFSKYLESIQIEIEVAKQLSPQVHCLAPTLSSILLKVPEIQARLSENTADVEAAYIELLTKEPRFQGYLKIGDRFAFFMSLSKHPFFNQVIEKIHGDRRWMQDEMYKNSRVFQSPEGFESVYGVQKIDLYDHIHEMIKDFSRKTDALLTLYGSETPVPDYQKQEWLFAALANKPIRFDTGELPSEFCEDIINLFPALIQENKEWVDVYRKTVSAHIRKKNFDKNRTRIESLIVNILNLIHRLKKSRVAIRDLKPDNILVMGDESDVYSHLADPDKYDLGLIDLETAARFNQKDPHEFRQPMLAGTSVYMTPSHIFKNEALIEVFGNEVPRVFYMQDWFSAIGMIYDLVKGRWLFKKTSRLIPEIARAIKRGKKNHTPMPDIFFNVSRAFWKSAEEEMTAAIEKDREMLQLIHLTLPEHIADMFLEEIRKEKDVLIGLIKDCAFKFSPKNAQKLIDATYEEIKEQRIKLEKGAEESQPSSDAHQHIVEMLKRIETLKLRLKNAKGIEDIDNQSITGEALLKFIFQRVSTVMNPF
jgi:serine/threonine protein kinase